MESSVPARDGVANGCELVGQTSSQLGLTRHPHDLITSEAEETGSSDRQKKENTAGDFYDLADGGSSSGRH